MSSTGQIIGTVVGAIIGFFIPGGYILLGAAIGGAIGSAIDPPKGPDGPRLSDLSVQTSTYGAAIPRVYGMLATYGNIFWVENNKLKEREEEEGGKGGSPESKTYKYSATFAVGICQGPIAGIGKIWAGSQLIYDGQSSDLESYVASGDAMGLIGRLFDFSGNNSYGVEGVKFSIYYGTDTQEPDPRMQASLGVNNCPAFRGLAYVVFYDFELEKYGNSLLGCPMKIEVFTEAADTGLTLLETQNIPLGPGIDPKLAGQNMANENLEVFAFADTEFTGEPATGVYRSIVSGIFGSPRVLTFSAPADAGLHVGNSSPVYRGTITRDGSRYLLDGVEWIADSDWVLFQTQVWMESNSMLGVCQRQDDVANSYVVRLGPDGFIQYGYIEPYAIEHSVFYTFVANGFVWVISYGTTYCYDESSLRLVAEYDNDFVPVDALSSWAVSVGTSGKVYRASGANNANVRTLNATMTGYGTESWTLNYGLGVVEKNNVLYLAWFDSTNNQIVIDAYQINGQVAQTVQLSDIITAECIKSGTLSAGDIDVSDINETVRGYKISQSGTIRSALAPLQAAWPFDCVQSGYTIDFIRRGKSSVYTVAEDELAASTGDEKKPRVTISREMDIQLPRRILVNYFDPAREYDINQQYSDRNSAEVIGVVTVELALAMTADEAAGKAEVLLYAAWLERNDIIFTLPSSYSWLEPADVITVPTDSGNYEVRVVSINYLQNGLLECAGKPNSAAVYTPTAKGQEGQSIGQVLTVAGDSLALLLDIPVLLDSQDAPGFAAAMIGYLSGWNGGTLVRSDDNGATWSSLLNFPAPSLIVGQLVSAFPAGRTDIIDTTTFPAISFISDTPSSVTEAAMLNGANHFAIGANGRWEIVGIQNFFYYSVDGNYYPYNLLRGRFGTEWAMGLAQPGDYVVALDSAKIKFVSANLNSIGTTKTYRAVTAGKSVDSATDVAFAYNGENLECLSPVFLNGWRNAGNDWTLTWVRRTRVGGEWRDFVDASLGEATEYYEIEVYSNSGYTTIKRTMAATTGSIVYSSALQVTDFGSNQTTLYLKIYQVSASVGRGHALTQSITRT